MSIIQEEDNYLATEIRLALIESNLDNIFENYQKFIPQKFPEKNKQNLKQLIQEIYNNLHAQNFQNINNVNEKYKSLSQQLTDFSDEIKKISYENEYYEKIKKTNDDLINLNQEINKILNKNLESLSGIYDYKKDDQEDLYNCGNSSNNISNDISLRCHDIKCKNKPKFYCNNHCYYYFCEECAEKECEFGHQFTKINEKRENEKLKSIRSFIYLIQMYSQIADYIYKSNDKNIEFPIMKEPYNIENQIGFLKDIIPFQNLINNNEQSQICHPLKTYLSQALDLTIESMDSIESRYNFVDELFSKKKDFTEIIQKYKHKSYYANIIVKNKFFINENNFQNCPILLDFKNIINELIIKECKISVNKLDFEYNFIIPNLNLINKKGGEIYYPPYGWFGIGLKLEKSNSNDKVKKGKIQKANAYYAFIDLDSDQIKNMLHDILYNGLKPNKNYQPKCDIRDQRNKKQTVGKGIYLYPNIYVIEHLTRNIECNNKSYKVALMTKVLSNKIRQPNDSTWVLDENDIEITRIIFKENII